MRKSLVFLAVLMSCLNVSAAVLWSQDFTLTSWSSSFFYNSSVSQSTGASYTCSSSNAVLLVSSNSDDYMITNTINVPQGKGIQLSFNSRKSASAGSTVNIQVFYLITGACAFNPSSTSDNGWVSWGTITPSTAGCTTNTLSLESDICGGQNIAICFYFPNASPSNWIAFDDMFVYDTGPVSYPVPVINASTSYTQNIAYSKWYGPVTTGNYSSNRASSVLMPYHSYKTSSSAYCSLYSSGSNGTANHSGVSSDYYVAFYTGFENCNSAGASQIVTKELNTSACAHPQIKYAYKGRYPCFGSNYDNTSDETYSSYAPELFVSTGQGYTWTELPVNSYFPDGLWHFASYALPSASNIKIRLGRGGSCSSPVEGIDHIRVFCRDCSISSLSAGIITGEAHPIVSTDYTYSITATPGATYYKWMIRAIDRTPPVLIEAACPNGTNPCIVSGQGTQNVVINFGSLDENYRVICIPYDAHPGTLSNPSDACYAALSYFPTSVSLPVELTYFRIHALETGLQIQWQTASETDNDYFIIEQSADGVNFREAGRVAGAGNSNQEINYVFTLEKIPYGISYYRLTQVDYDGRSSHSQILSVINESPEEGLQVFTSQGQLTITSEADVLYPLSLQLFDGLGRCVLTASDLLIPAGSTLLLDLPAVSEGLYFYRISGTGVRKGERIYISK